MEVRNLITPAGLDALKKELNELKNVERPKVAADVNWAAGNGDLSENGDYIYGKQRLAEIDFRVHALMKSIESAFVIDPAAQTNRDQVFFGATVTYESERSGERTITIVGVDEVLHDKSYVSCQAPVAIALMKASVGDVVKVKTPAGIDNLEIIEISYA
ncbi:transcription elongation factor GreB [Telmatospirillum sp.]|uniref:transcription elongation factor GreB n=1 Tax=Telmatospirillum sp. TaxID=2079197 RepID=UPI0028414FBF|nr:transcription elongation factor GreB [Telmatospirillum sp.]MDR3440493.1 transcription elongation factor GreB [Telmatospirillum sp.]